MRLFRAGDYAAFGRIDLGDDADNVRVDIAANLVFIGYGSGALAVIDPRSRSKVADILLKDHPESFQLARAGDRIFINVPNAKAIAVIDRASVKQILSWPLEPWRQFPHGAGRRCPARRCRLSQPRQARRLLHAGRCHRR